MVAAAQTVLKLNFFFTDKTINFQKLSSMFFFVLFFNRNAIVLFFLFFIKYSFMNPYALKMAWHGIVLGAMQGPSSWTQVVMSCVWLTGLLNQKGRFMAIQNTIVR